MISHVVTPPKMSQRQRRALDAGMINDYLLIRGAIRIQRLSSGCFLEIRTLRLSTVTVKTCKTPQRGGREKIPNR